MKIAYLDSRASLLYNDLVTAMEGYCCIDSGDALLALAPRGDGYVVERRLLVEQVEVGGDTLAVRCVAVDCIGATSIVRGDPRLGRWWPDLRAYPVGVPDEVAAAMGWRRSR